MGSERPPMRCRDNRYSAWVILMVAAALIGTILVVLRPERKSLPGEVGPAGSNPVAARIESSPDTHALAARPAEAQARARRPESAAQIVARRAAQFARSRREVLYAIARAKHVTVPAEVEQFFDAAEAGNWEQAHALFEKLQAERKTQPHAAELDQLWAPVLTALNALQQVHLWPAPQYLAYGNAILDSLHPGMVYVGGTDPGRGIPELLSATADGEQHIVITQNGLADATYLDYLRFQYGDQLALPSADQAQSARADYLADFQKRLAHDQQFPDEPKQIKPGEQAGSADDLGKWSPVSIMLVNERIMQTILQANPNVAFGLEESFPLKSTYADAGTLGPIMELRGGDNQNPLTAETAAQSIAYWQSTAQQLLADPAAADSPEWLKAYGKMADAQANLFAAHGLNDQAEQAFQVSLQISPGLPESVFGYVQLLVNENRAPDALTVVRAAAQLQPDNRQFADLANRLAATRQ